MLCEHEKNFQNILHESCSTTKDEYDRIQIRPGASSLGPNL